MKTHKRYYTQKRQLSKKIVIIPILILCLIIIIFFQWNRIQLALKGYNLTEQSMILALEDQDIQNFLKNDKIINLDSWKKYESSHHYQEYAYYQKTHPDNSPQDVISYIDTFYEKYHAKLTHLHYSYDTLIKMMEKAQLSDFEYIIQQNLDYQQTQPYLDVKGIIYTDLKSYIDSHKQPIDAILSISYPFINSQHKVTQNYLILDPTSYSTLIKKGFQISTDYTPNDLVTPNIPFSKDCENKQLRKEAANALETMYQDALKSNLHFAINSAYRSYQQQQAIYDEYHRLYDEVTADGLVSIPGSSEHQLGLGVDLTSQSVLDGTWRFFGDTKEYQWAIENAHFYGYILRYPKDKSQKTGTSNEPWHFRYVGQEIAKIIYNNNWTLEDYILHYGLSSDFIKMS